MTRVFAREVLTTDRHVSAEALARLAGRVARLDNRLAARLATEAADVALASAGAPVRAELLVAVAVILLRSRAPSFEAVVEQALAVLATRGTNVVPMALSLAAAATTRSAPLVLRAAAVAAEAVVRLQREKQDSQQTFETLTRIMIDARCWADAERYLDACGRDPMALRTDLIAVARYDDPELAQRCAQRPLGNPGARYRISYYLTRQLWSCAADEARRSPDGDSVECLCQVAVGVTDADPSLADALLDEALDRTATAAAGRPESYAAVVAALAVRDPQRAAALVPEALHEHESMDDPWQRLLAAPPMAGALAKVAPDQVAQFVAGVELVARMSAEIPVHQRLCRLIETCRAARLTDRALLLADEVEHLAETATGYGDRQRGLIELLRTLGELPAASLRRVGTAAVRAVLDFRRDPEAERADLLLATSDLSYLTVVRRDLTWALAGAQLWDTAEDFIAQISDRHEQADNARLLTECLLDDGRLTAAARMLRLAQPGVERDLAYARLAEQLDELDSWDEARAAITAVDNSEAQAAALDNHLRHLATACQKATGETRMYLEGLVRSLVAEIVVARNSLQAVGLGAAALPEEAEAAAWAAYQLLEAAAA